MQDNHQTKGPITAYGTVCTNGTATHGKPILIVRAELPDGTTLAPGDRVLVMVIKQ